MRQLFLGSLAVLLASGTSGSLIADDSGEIKQSFFGSGLSQKMGGYRPLRAQMDQEAEIVKVAPKDLVNPGYGIIKIGERSYPFIVDSLDEGKSNFWIDSNADGDLTNDPETKWVPNKQGEFTMYNGECTVILQNGQQATLGVYRFDPSDKRRAALAKTLMYFEDFGNEFEIKLDGKTFSTFFPGVPKTKDALSLDRNGDGKTSRNYETLYVGKPFNFTGTTYVIESVDGKLVIEKSSESLPMLDLPPDLQLGKPALKFTATTMNGEEVQFPGSYAGKIVMVDFWATWCGPCIGEIPNMVKAYAEWHDSGFEILGISFDQEGKEEAIRKFLAEKELPWSQIYEGKFWDTTLGKMHDVSGIPFVLLVDGDSGEIIGTSKELRGEKLSAYIGEQLRKKTGKDLQPKEYTPKTKDEEEKK